MIKTVLAEFPEHTVDGWLYGGQFLNDYIQIMENVPILLSRILDSPLQHNQDWVSQDLEIWGPRVKALLDILADDYQNKLDFLLESFELRNELNSKMLHVCISDMTAKLIDLLTNISRFNEKMNGLVMIVLC